VSREIATRVFDAVRAALAPATARDAGGGP